MEFSGCSVAERDRTGSADFGPGFDQRATRGQAVIGSGTGECDSTRKRDCEVRAGVDDWSQIDRSRIHGKDDVI